MHRAEDREARVERRSRDWDVWRPWLTGRPSSGYARRLRPLPNRPSARGRWERERDLPRMPDFWVRPPRWLRRHFVPPTPYRTPYDRQVYDDRDDLTDADLEHWVVLHAASCCLAHRAAAHEAMMNAVGQLAAAADRVSADSTSERPQLDDVAAQARDGPVDPLPLVDQLAAVLVCAPAGPPAPVAG